MKRFDVEEFDKQHKRIRNVVFIGTILTVVSIIILWLLVTISISQEVEKNGGIGKSIGKFLNDINSEIK